jgi:membrane-associated phospholipid phosphatase
MKKQAISYFFYATFIFWALAITWVCLADKLLIHKTLTFFQTNFLDVFFQVFTYMGDGVFIVLISIVFLFINARIALLQIISYASSGMISLLLKYSFFAESHRPYYFLKDDPTFHKITNFTYHISNSFPSGHTTSIFALMTIFALVYQQSKLVSVAFFLCAILVGFSRIYLSQHFLIDVVAGSFIGLASANVVFRILNHKLVKLNSSILNLKQANE